MLTWASPWMKSFAPWSPLEFAMVLSSYKESGKKASTTWRGKLIWCQNDIGRLSSFRCRRQQSESGLN